MSTKRKKGSKSFLGRLVAIGVIKTMNQALQEKLIIEEEEIVDKLLPNLRVEFIKTMPISNYYRNCSQRVRFRVMAIVADALHWLGNFNRQNNRSS